MEYLELNLQYALLSLHNLVYSHLKYLRVCMNNWILLLLRSYLLLYLSIYSPFLLHHLYISKTNMMLLNVVPPWVLLNDGSIIDNFYILILLIVFLFKDIYPYLHILLEYKLMKLYTNFYTNHILSILSIKPNFCESGHFHNIYLLSR
jgi:hypothetical protein